MQFTHSLNTKLLLAFSELTLAQSYSTFYCNCHGHVFKTLPIGQIEAMNANPLRDGVNSSSVRTALFFTLMIMVKKPAKPFLLFSSTTPLLFKCQIHKDSGLPQAFSPGLSSYSCGYRVIDFPVHRQPAPRVGSDMSPGRDTRKFALLYNKDVKGQEAETGCLPIQGRPGE